MPLTRRKRVKRRGRGPSCFISYAWDNKAHENWVAKLAEALAANGVRVHVDFWETYPGMDIAQYMESQLRSNRLVLLICTRRYAQRANKRQGGVGYETGIVTGQIFRNSRKAKKFIPVLRDGTPGKSLPSFLKHRLFIDFRGRAFKQPLVQLLRFIFNQRARTPPTVGPPPNFAAIILPKKRPKRPPRIAKSARSRVLREKQRELTRLMEAKWPAGSVREERRVERLSNAATHVAALRPSKKRGGGA